MPKHAYGFEVLLRCIAAFGACAAVAAPTASAGWLPSQPLSAPDLPANNPEIALGADGRMFAAWVRSDGSNLRIETTVRPPGGPLEQPQIVSPAGASAGSPQVAVDSQGNALLTWIRNGALQWTSRAADAPAFDGLHSLPLSGAQAGSYRLAVAPSGEAAIVVETTQGSMPVNISLRVYTRPVGGDFTAASPTLESLSDGQQDDYNLTPLDMDVDAQGGFYATWNFRHYGSSGSSQSAVKLARRLPGEASFTVQQVASAADSGAGGVSDASVGPATTAVDAAGAMGVVFTRQNLGLNPFESTLLLATRPPGGSFASPGAPNETVVPSEQDGPSEADLDMNGDGSGLIVWRRGPGSDDRIEGCVRPPGGPCGATKTLATGTVLQPLGAIGASGDAIATWRRGLGVLEGSFRPAGGTFGEAHELGSGASALTSQEGMAVDPLGHAAVAVDRFIAGSGRFIEAVVNDPVPPSIDPLSVPAEASQNGSLAFGGGVFDVWGPVTASWDFGDGSGAPGPVASHAYSAAGVFTAALTATDAGGNSATSSAQVAVKDTVRPRILSFGLTNEAFAVGSKATPLSARRRVPRGTTFRFRVSETATARISIQRKVRRRWRTQVTLRRKTRAGVKRVPFSGRVRRKALRPGRYRAVLVAVDAAKNRSRPRRVGFRVVHG